MDDNLQNNGTEDEAAAVNFEVTPCRRCEQVLGQEEVLQAEGDYYHVRCFV